MSLNVPLLRSSFDLVVTNSPDITRRFYDIFFARYPQVRPMFSRNTRDKQEAMLTQALVLVMDHLEDAPWLTSTLHAMGEKHVSYGVRDEMYGWVGESLLAAMSDAAGDAWDAELHAAWSDALGAIAGLMIEGARRAQPSAAE